MSYQKDREEFLTLCAHDGISTDTARALLRYSTTATRLAVAACNGEWPCDGEWASGKGKRWLRTCAKCGCAAAKSSFRRDLCPDCRCDDLIRKVCAAANLPFELSGDPRGCVVKIKLPTYRGNSWAGDGMTCVPAPYL